MLWLDEPRFDGPIAKGILRGATRLVVDSTRFPAVLPALPALAGDEPPYIADLSWTKITGWRDVVAQLFDPPAHRELLPSLREIRIAHVAGTDSQAMLLAGWLRSHVDSDRRRRARRRRPQRHAAGLDRPRRPRVRRRRARPSTGPWRASR